LLHDKECTNGSITSQLELYLQQTLPLLCLEPYKHPKTTKLNLNTPWMKQLFFKKNIDYYSLIENDHFAIGPCD
jgi:hypothetical protein